MTQKKTLIILAIVLVVLVVLILVGIPLLTGAGQQPAAEQEEKTYLCSLSRSELERIACTMGDRSILLLCVDGVWQTEGGEPLDDNTAYNLVSAVCGLYSTQIAHTGERHFADCGLNEPTLTVSAATAAGDTITIRVGGYNNGLDRWYCTIDGGKTIYLIGNNLYNRYSALF